MADLLNDQFKSVFVTEFDSDIPSVGSSPYKGISHLTITSIGIEKLLRELDTSKSPGPDGIPPWFLRIGTLQLYSRSSVGSI